VTRTNYKLHIRIVVQAFPCFACNSTLLYRVHNGPPLTQKSSPCLCTCVLFSHLRLRLPNDPLSSGYVATTSTFVILPMRATCLAQLTFLDLVTLITSDAEYKLPIIKYCIETIPLLYCTVCKLPRSQFTQQASNEMDTVCGLRVTNH
jgi:hypothetical protein